MLNNPLDLSDSLSYSCHVTITRGNTLPREFFASWRQSADFPCGSGATPGCVVMGSGDSALKARIKRSGVSLLSLDRTALLQMAPVLQMLRNEIHDHKAVLFHIL
jgi:hypothetical protein